MKLSFTTLGCLEWDLDTILRRAHEYGYHGVDFRGYLSEFDIWKQPAFGADRKATAARFADAGIEVPCFSSSAAVFANPERAGAEVRAYAELCAVFGARFIRVFAGRLEGRPPAEAERVAVDTLRSLAPVAADHGAALVLETHDDWVRSEVLRRVMEAVDSPAVGILWDVHHPYRYAGESPAQTWRELGRWVRYTHWKDSTPDPAKPGGFVGCLPGDGDLPLLATFDVLKSGGYDGYLALEWERKWQPYLPALDVALPRFADLMRTFGAV